MTLQRPPGLILEQVLDASGKAESVVVAGILPGSPAEASGAVECGDTVVAVSSSLGNVMWPYRYVVDKHVVNRNNICSGGVVPLLTETWCTGGEMGLLRCGESRVRKQWPVVTV